MLNNYAWMKKQETFGKDERLSSRKLISVLFTKGTNLYRFPFRLVFLEVNNNDFPVSDSLCQVMFSVSKKNFKHAVKRNRIKRLMREAYRKNKYILYQELAQQNKKLIIAIICNGKTIPDYKQTETKIIQHLQRLIQEINKNKNEKNTNGTSSQN